MKWPVIEKIRIRQVNGVLRGASSKRRHVVTVMLPRGCIVSYRDGKLGDGLDQSVETVLGGVAAKILVATQFFMLILGHGRLFRKLSFALLSSISRIVWF